MTVSVGVDVGGTAIKAVGWDGAGIVARARVETPAESADLLLAIRGISDRLGPGLPLGVGLAGLVDHQRGVLRWAPHLPGVDVDVAGFLASDRPVVVVDNDANFAALGEHLSGSGDRRGTTVMLTVGTGIGMGLVVDGAIHHGRGFAGEAGHITVQPDGAPCSCGRRGCWETVVSGRHLDADAVRLLGSGATGADLAAAAAGGDESARAVFDEAAAWLAVGVEAIVLALDPDVVVVGGAVADSGDLLLDPVRRRLAGTQGASHRTVTPVRASILGADAGAVGAAMAAHRRAGLPETPEKT